MYIVKAVCPFAITQNIITGTYKTCTRIVQEFCQSLCAKIKSNQITGMRLGAARRQLCLTCSIMLTLQDLWKTCASPAIL